VIQIDVKLVLLMEGNYEVHHSDGLRSHDIHAKSHEDWYRC
jgi:hypothetical protein